MRGIPFFVSLTVGKILVSLPSSLFCVLVGRLAISVSDGVPKNLAYARLLDMAHSGLG